MALTETAVGKVSLITPSIVVSVLALLFTVGSFWWIQVRRGRPRCYMSHVYSGSFAPGKLIVVLPLVLHNPGPAPLVITDLRIRIDAPSADHVDAAALPIYLRWIASHTSVYPDNATRRFTAPFPVDGRKAIDRFIEFQRDDPPTSLEAGPYVATVEALVMPRRRRAGQRWRPLLSYTFNTQLAVQGRANLLPRSNDPDLNGKGDQVWR